MKFLPLSILSTVVCATILSIAATVNPIGDGEVAAPGIVLVDSASMHLPLEDSIVEFGLSFSGTTYHYTGKSPATGFDCSGFTHFVFGHFGIYLSPASKEQVYAGQQVPLEKVRKGDLLIFTGTQVSLREPGHVGIVVSEPGETPVRFVHSSSNGGVKISEVQGTRYADRFLQVRRLF